MKVRDEFIADHRGQRYVLFAGLLDTAHERGLRSIDTELLQVPTPENGNVAITKAIVTMEEDDEHSTVRTTMAKTFSGIGDASPENVARNMVPHIIRMSETRAKARALRDAINVSATAYEELGDETSPAKPSAKPSRQGGERRRKPAQASGEATDDEPASEMQLKAIYALLGKLDMDYKEFEANHHLIIKELTNKRASEVIGWLQDIKRQQEEG